MTDLPNWLSRRIPAMTRSGQLVLNSEHSLDLRVFSYPNFVKTYVPMLKHLQLSGTTVTSLDGLPPLVHLQSFVADRSGIDSFANFRAIAPASKISLKETPLSEQQNYRLSILLICGSNVASIDGVGISCSLRTRASTYPSHAGEFIEKGWIVEIPCPDNERWQVLSERFDSPMPIPQIHTLLEGSSQPEIEDFEIIMQALRDRQDAMFGRAEERLAIQKELFDDDQLAEAIGILLQEAGLTVDANRDDHLVDEIWKICRKAHQNRQSMMARYEEEDI
jgi:hypothetical protein